MSWVGGGTRAITGVRLEAEGEAGTVGKEPTLLWFPWEGKGKAGSASLSSAHLNKLSKHWGYRLCLTPGLGVIRADGQRAMGEGPRRRWLVVRT